MFDVSHLIVNKPLRSKRELIRNMCIVIGYNGFPTK